MKIYVNGRESRCSSCSRPSVDSEVWFDAAEEPETCAGCGVFLWPAAHPDYGLADVRTKVFWIKATLSLVELRPYHSQFQGQRPIQMPAFREAVSRVEAPLWRRVLAVETLRLTQTCLPPLPVTLQAQVGTEALIECSPVVVLTRVRDPGRVPSLRVRAWPFTLRDLGLLGA